METRTSAETVVNLQFSIDVMLKDLLAEGGIEEFAERARNTLEEQIRPLLAQLPNSPDPDANKPEPAAAARGGVQVDLEPPMSQTVTFQRLGIPESAVTHFRGKTQP